MSPDDVRALARDAHARWTSLELVHRSSYEDLRAWLRHGDEWRAPPGELPDGVDLALDLEIGIVVSSRDRGGRHAGWFTNEIMAVT